jgi:hypothetical protein
MWLDWVGGRGFLRLPSKRRRDGSGGWRVGERVAGIGVAYVRPTRARNVTPRKLDWRKHKTGTAAFA